MRHPATLQCSSKRRRAQVYLNLFPVPRPIPRYNFPLRRTYPMPAFHLDRARASREIGATVRLALPLILAQLAAVGSNVIDAVLAGHVGAHVLGAVAIGANIWM